MVHIQDKLAITPNNKHATPNPELMRKSFLLSKDDIVKVTKEDTNKTKETDTSKVDIKTCFIL